MINKNIEYVELKKNNDNTINDKIIFLKTYLKFINLFGFYIFVFSIDGILTSIGIKIGFIESNKLYYFISELFNVSLNTSNWIIHLSLMFLYLLMLLFISKNPYTFKLNELKLLIKILYATILFYICVNSYNGILIILNIY